MKGKPKRCTTLGSLMCSRATAHNCKTTQLAMMYPHAIGRSISSGGELVLVSVILEQMASMHPATTHAMDAHSLESGCSKRTTFETSKLMIIETAPKMPTVIGGNHVNAKKSIVEAANDIKIAMINSGRQYTAVLMGVGLLRRRVLGSI